MFERYFPDVATAEGAATATKGGMVAALVFTATLALSLIILMASGHMLGEPKGSAEDFYASVFGIVGEMILPLVAAWRFRRQKGLIVGSLTLALYLFEVVTKLIAGTTNVGWIFFYLAIIAGLVNGVRGAYAFKRMAFDTL